MKSIRAISIASTSEILLFFVIQTDKDTDQIAMFERKRRIRQA